MKISKKIIFASALLSGIGIITSGFIVGWQALSVASTTIEKRAFNQLVAIREIQKSQIENYFQTIEKEIVTLSNNHMIIDLASEISPAFFEFDQQTSLRDNKKLENYYKNQFDKVYKNNNPASSITSLNKFEQLNQNSKSLQHAYISGNPNPLGSKDLLVNASDNSTYSEIHKKYHPQLSQYLNAFGFYDIFIVEPETGFIIYSVYKELDFATSLLSGPYHETGLAKAFNAANTSTSRDSHYLIDFQPYFPSYDAAAAFMSSPIYSSDGNKIGILIFQMPIDKINNIMTYEQQWKKAGLGESGETYLVGDDYLLRSQSRFLIEDKNNYAQALHRTKMDKKVINKIIASESAIGLQPVKSKGAIAAISGQTGIDSILDYRKVEVLSAYAPLKINGVNWGILSEIDVDEAMKDKSEMTSSLWLFMSLIMIVLLPIAMISGYFVSRQISNPINNFISQVNNITQAQDLTARVNYSGNDELFSLASSFNQLLEKVQKILKGVDSLSTNLLTSTEKILQNINETTKQTMQQSESADSVVDATNELLITIHEVTNNASEAAEAVTETKEKCIGSSVSAENLSKGISTLDEQMNQASQSIEKLAEESQSIGSVLDVIQSIAEQTNLLALNAAIEAARAGEQGRGFAVVADEVRTLASRTQSSTEDIRDKIGGLQTETGAAVKIVSTSSKMSNSSISSCEDNREVLANVVTLIEQLSQMNFQIASAATQQSAMVDDINRNITDIASTAHSITKKAELSKSDIQKIVELVRNINSQMREFNV